MADGSSPAPEVANKDRRPDLEGVVNRHVPADFPKTRVTKSANHSSLRARVTPDNASVRRWLLQNRSALVTEVEIRKVALDADQPDEHLVTVPFKSSGGQSYRWVLLIDGQSDGHAVIRDWSRRGVDSQAHVVAHGQGGVAALAVQMTYKGRSIVQLWRLQSAGNLVLLGSYGVDIGESAVFEPPNRIVLTADGGTVQNLAVVAKGSGFEVKGSSAP